jgi:hypothetical protein
MAIALSLIAAWITVVFFYLLKGKLPFLINMITFMVIAIFSRNYTTIMTMELKRLKSTEDPFLFISFLLHREIIIPFLTLIFINVFVVSDDWKKKLFFLIIIVTTMQTMDVYLVQFEVLEFVKWSYVQAFIVNLGYLLIGLFVSKLLLYLQKREMRLHENSL